MTHPEPSEPISFQAHKQEKWLERFQQASPKGRYELLLTTLNEPVLALEPDVLSYAVASVSQILGHNNLLAEQKALTALLEAKAPASYAQIRGIQALIDLQEALFLKQPEKFETLFAVWLDPQLEVPPPYTLILKSLAYYGYPKAAAELADKLAKKLGKKALEEDDLLDFSLEQHRIHYLFEQITHALQEGVDPPWKPFESGLRDLGIKTKQEQAFFREQWESSDKVQFNRLRTALADGDPELGLFHSRLIFSRWMYKQHRLNLFTGGDMVQHALEMWLTDAPDPLPSLEKLVQIDEARLHAYFERLEFDPNWDLLDAFTLLWGLPHVYDWLVECGLCKPALRGQVMNWVEKLRPILIEQRSNALWGYDFVHRWPCPLGREAAEFQAEAQVFAQTLNQSSPLSDNPEDSRHFDEDFPDIPDELVDSVGAMLEDQGIEVLDGLLKEIEEQMGHEAVGALLAALEAQGYLELEYEGDEE
ncbi:MAG: hypothetical protein IV090_18505 [Candidatus Sericytochromatia bacterium]|nr:hypothetical protein [Candidatus Sericytochromatia bacterium]